MRTNHRPPHPDDPPKSIKRLHGAHASRANPDFGGKTSRQARGALPKQWKGCNGLSLTPGRTHAQSASHGRTSPWPLPVGCMAGTRPAAARLRGHSPGHSHPSFGHRYPSFGAAQRNATAATRTAVGVGEGGGVSGLCAVLALRQSDVKSGRRGSSRSTQHVVWGRAPDSGVQEVRRTGVQKVWQQSPRETQSLRSKNENQSNTRTMQSKSCPARVRAPCAHRVRTAANTGGGGGRWAGGSMGRALRHS